MENLEELVGFLYDDKFQLNCVEIVMKHSLQMRGFYLDVPDVRNITQTLS